MKEDRTHPDDEHELASEELVPEDDAIIGRALRWSLVAILALGAIGALLFLLLKPKEIIVPEQTLEAAAPETVVQEAVPPTVTFTDITAEAGIMFVHTNGAAGEKLLPETMGSGVAVFDYDNDGDPDLFFANGTTWPHDAASGTPPPCALYRNDGSGRFEDVSTAAGADLSLYATGVAVADYDGDGWRDLFVAAVGNDRLLRNVEGRFEDVTAQAGVAGNADGWSTSASFFDYDNDDDLDLFVLQYVRWSKEIDFAIDYQLTGVGRAYGPPVNYEGTFSTFYRNEGDGTFTDVSAAAGIEVRNEATDVPVGKGLGLAPIDIDRDGWMDVLVANDTVQNFFFHNQGDGTFLEMGELYGLAYGRAGEATGAMGIDAAHYRNDEALGFAIGNFANEMTSLYISQGDPTLYADEAIGDGIGAPSRRLLSFGMLFFDYDLDGRLDILETNGHLESEINTVEPSQTYEQPAQLFWNAGNDHRQTFVEVAIEQAGALATAIVGRGSAYADIDADGDLDVVLTQTGRAPLLLRNDQHLDHHWLRLQLVGSSGNREAIGARVELEVGGTTQTRTVMPTRSYQSQSEPVLTFGLGTHDAVDAITITWPDGTTQNVPPPPVDQLLVIEKSARS